MVRALLVPSVGGGTVRANSTCLADEPVSTGGGTHAGNSVDMLMQFLTAGVWQLPPLHQQGNLVCVPKAEGGEV